VEIPSLPDAAVRPVRAAVRRAVRRILAGSADGQPPWVSALSEPGDAGWFGPGSAVWAVHGSLSTLVGGARALLLQSAHPLALAGVQQHSDYRSDALARLQRTNRFVTTTTYGSSAQAAAAVDRVRAVHRVVRGTAPDGRPYAADDPHLLLWVHLALADSMLAAARRYGPRHVDGDAYVAESAVTARRLGIPDPPTTEHALAVALDSYRAELACDGNTREVVRFLLAPPLPVAAQPAYQVIVRAAVDLLPSWAPGLLGLPDRPGAIRAADEAACRLLFDVLGALLGPSGPAEQAALRRAEGA
jgi:uncharacterized protein (DUF2236 family)